jgi:hypothetical protein
MQALLLTEARSRSFAALKDDKVEVGASSRSFSGNPLELVILTNGKDLLFTYASTLADRGKKQVLRCAQG